MKVQVQQHVIKMVRVLQHVVWQTMNKRVGKLVRQRAQEAIKLNGGQIQAEDKEVKAALQKIIDATIAQQRAVNPPKAQVKQ
eukprot:UN03982